MAKKSASSEKTQPKQVRKLRVKEVTPESILEQNLQLSIEPEKHNRQFFLILIIATAVISSLVTFGITNQFAPGLADRTTLAAQTSGGVCLSEKELQIGRAHV